MSGQIPKDFIDQVIDKADLVEIISARISVKKKGKNYLGCCPFHDEKTPSFNINPIKQFYYCFGCSASGNIITFLMEHDNLTFVEAITEVADSVGMSVPESEISNSIEFNNNFNNKSNNSSNNNFNLNSDIKSLFCVMHNVAKFYEWSLHKDKESIEYLKNRGISGELAKLYQIGWVPDKWDNLEKFIIGKSIDISYKNKKSKNISNNISNNISSKIKANKIIVNKTMLDNCGLLINSEKGGFYDRFRDRLMFPIRDRRGRVVGFGGRVIKKERTPKYLNSPETMLFAKSKILYGLYEILQSNKNSSRICVVEGYMDVIGLAQYGVNYAVATLGTSTSGDHIRQLLQFTKEIVFCFDGDKAGKGAAWRALNSCLPFMNGSFQVKFLFLPDGEDPDSIVKSIGKDGFEKKLDLCEPLSEFLFNNISGNLNLGFADGKAVFLDKLLPLISEVPDGAYKLLLSESAAKRLQVSVRQIDSQIKSYKKFNISSNISSNINSKSSGVNSGIRGYLEKSIVYLLCDYKLALDINIDDLIMTNNIKGPGKVLIKLICFLQERFKANTNISIQDVIDNFSQEKIKKKLAELALMNHPFGHEELRKEFFELIDRFKRECQLSGIDDLIAKSRSESLNTEEKEQLKGLLAKHKLKLK